MQDRYTGDVGDFGKYGMLKALCEDGLSLGVVWYLFPDEEDNGDGGHVGYLRRTTQNLRRFRDCNPALYRTLDKIVRDEGRRVASIRKLGVLPEGAAFYEAPLSFRGMPWAGPRTGRERLEHREEWVQGALETTRGCDVVFADPDNGFEIASVQRHHIKGPKYAFFDELEPYLDRGQSLMVYQQVSHVSVTKRIEERFADIREHFGQTKGYSGIFALHYRPGSARAFFIVPSDAHKNVLTARAERIAQNPCWGQHFTLIKPDQ